MQTSCVVYHVQFVLFANLFVLAFTVDCKTAINQELLGKVSQPQFTHFLRVPFFAISDALPGTNMMCSCKKRRKMTWFSWTKQMYLIIVVRQLCSERITKSNNLKPSDVVCTLLSPLHSSLNELNVYSHPHSWAVIWLLHKTLWLEHKMATIHYFPEYLRNERLLTLCAYNKIDFDNIVSIMSNLATCVSNFLICSQLFSWRIAAL